MDFWTEELALVEAAAVRIQQLEVEAEKRFDEVHAAADAAGKREAALMSKEFTHWIAARADTDAAWGRWWTVMEAKPPAQASRA